jgi:hypothetical protein
MSDGFEVIGTNDSAPFSLKLQRGDGMLLLAMNWKSGTPPDDFVGFAIEYLTGDPRIHGQHRHAELRGGAESCAGTTARNIPWRVEERNAARRLRRLRHRIPNG